MKEKTTYQQFQCEVIIFNSDIIRTSNPEDDHLINDAGDWGFSNNAFKGE